LGRLTQEQGWLKQVPRYLLNVVCLTGPVLAFLLYLHPPTHHNTTSPSAALLVLCMSNYGVVHARCELMLCGYGFLVSVAVDCGTSNTPRGIPDLSTRVPCHSPYARPSPSPSQRKDEAVLLFQDVLLVTTHSLSTVSVCQSNKRISSAGSSGSFEGPYEYECCLTACAPPLIIEASKEQQLQNMSSRLLVHRPLAGLLN
jgi:hypothetical protein